MILTPSIHSPHGEIFGQPGKMMKICYEKYPSWVSGDFPWCFFSQWEIYEGFFNDFEEQIHVVGYVGSGHPWDWFGRNLCVGLVNMFQQ